jgi:nitronate monooxygenase
MQPGHDFFPAADGHRPRWPAATQQGWELHNQGMPFNQDRLLIPAIAAPMFLVSGPDLVVETCRSGIMGTFPALNQKTSEGYTAWLDEIEARLEGLEASPFGVNLIVHKTNGRLARDVEITVQHRVPIVITSLGAVRDVVDAIHSYGGLVFHDVINLRHATKAAEAGVDGLILVCAGAGGHAGLLNPFAFVAEVRRMFDKTLILSGSITHGRQIAATQLMGADLAYLGTRFINTRESLAAAGHKEMIVESTAKDIVYTPAVSGVAGNFLRGSIIAAGGDPDNLQSSVKLDMSSEGEAKAWKDVWSAGHGVGNIDDILPAAELCRRLIAEYREAMGCFAAGAYRSQAG